MSKVGRSSFLKVNWAGNDLEGWHDYLFDNEIAVIKDHAGVICGFAQGS